MDLYPGLTATQLKTYTISITVRVGSSVSERWVEETRAYNMFAAIEDVKDKCLKHCEELYKKYTITDLEAEVHAS